MPSQTRTRLLLTAALLAATTAAHADDQATKILQAAKQASGGDAWNKLTALTETGTTTTGGLTGPVHATLDVTTGHYTDDYVLGPMRGSEGFDGKTVWSTDSTGQPSVEGGGENKLGAVNQAYRNSLAFWFPQRHAATITYAGKRKDGAQTFDIIHIVPAGGRPFDLWVDQSSHLITRVQEQEENDLQTEFYSDFRTVSGVRLPFKTLTSIGNPKYDQRATLTNIQALPAVDATRFAMPAPPAADFTFPPGKNSITLPITLVSNHIHLTASINGRPAPFLFDTGAINVIAREHQADFGLKDTGKLPGAGVGEAKEDAGIAKVDDFDIGGLKLKQQVFLSFNLGALSHAAGENMVGIMGYEVAKRVVVVIDYAGQTITFIKPAAFTPPPGAAEVKLEFNEHTPQVDGALDGIPGKFDIDTGSRASVDVTSPFVAAHNLRARYRTTPTIISGWGVGGPARSQVGYASTLTLGSVNIPNPIVELSTQSKGSFASPYYAGNVGGGVLKRFTVTLDYPHSRMFLQKNAHFADPDVFDRSGLWLGLNRNGHDADVVAVVPGSAAATAGLKVGDLITQVDNRSPGDITLPTLRGQFRQNPGTTLHLTVTSKQATRDVALKLAEYVPVPGTARK